jgi:hypothetical protein
VTTTGRKSERSGEPKPPSAPRRKRESLGVPKLPPPPDRTVSSAYADLESRARSILRTNIEIQALLRMIDIDLPKKLREIAETVESLRRLEADLAIEARRLRGYLPSDPDKTPTYGQ